MGPGEMQLLLDRIASAERAINTRIQDYTATTNAQFMAMERRHGEQYRDLNDAIGQVQTDVTEMKAAAEAVKEESGKPVRWGHLTLIMIGFTILDFLGHYLTRPTHLP